MTFETLKRSHLKRNILIAVGVVLILSAVILTFTRAKYRTTQSMPLLQGTINFSPSDFNMVAMYLNQDGALPAGQTDIVPKFGYTLNEEQSTCESPDGVEDNVGINYVDSSLTFSNVIKKGTKCTAYFDLIPDDQAPTVSLTRSGTDTSITLTADASDNIGIYYYYYKLDNEEEIRSEEASYTFDGLVKDSVHTVTVRVVDAAGNEASDSDVATVGIGGSEYILATANAPTSNTTDWTNNGTGTTYYYTGNPNNWVQFGGFWWRIIRINGDGSIRMIYQGTSANTTGTGTQIGTSTFNDEHENNAHVGYMFTSGELHGLGSSSIIKGVLDTWYQNNLALVDDAKYIDGNAGFCGDRYPSTDRDTSNGLGGTGTTTTYYGAYIRLLSNNSPSLQCNDSADIYTTSGSSTGNEALTYPIGLLTSDEAALTGITYSSDNRGSYLYTGQDYWTMSPAYFNRNVSNDAYVFRVDSSGRLDTYYVPDVPQGVRPVINLKSDTPLSGLGTTSDPFILAP